MRNVVFFFSLQVEYLKFSSTKKNGNGYFSLQSLSYDSQLLDFWNSFCNSKWTHENLGWKIPPINLPIPLFFYPNFHFNPRFSVYTRLYLQSFCTFVLSFCLEVLPFFQAKKSSLSISLVVPVSTKHNSGGILLLLTEKEGEVCVFIWQCPNRI